MFQLGTSEWPGLAKLAEEAGEVVQVIGKLMATGGNVAHWEGSDLAERLEEELGDLLAAVEFVIAHNGALNETQINARKLRKRQIFETWHEDELQHERLREHGP